MITEKMLFLQCRSLKESWLDVSFIITARELFRTMYLHPNLEHVKGAMEERDERPEWCLNTDGHIRSVIMGRSVTIPIIESEVQLGEFGLVYFADWDQVRSRTRTVIVQVMGE